MKSSTTPLFTLGKGKFYKEDDHLQLDVGPFAAALEFASERKAVVSVCGTFEDDSFKSLFVSMQICGKPDGTFFRAGLSSLGLSAESVVMVGDDIVSDVGGAQAAGIRGIQVRMVTMVPTVTIYGQDGYYIGHYGQWSGWSRSLWSGMRM